jgi:glycosyltransferase involved in cell wall biosynthesis
MRVLLSAYACEPNRGSEPGNGWNWALNLAKEGHEILLMTCPYGRKAIEEELTVIDNTLSIKVEYVDVPLWTKSFLKGRFGLFVHYYLWQMSAFRAAEKLTENIDLVHHVTWGSIKGGSSLWRLNKPFVFGPIGGGQVAPSGFGSIFGKGYIFEQIRTVYTKRILPFNPISKTLMRNASLVLVTNKETSDLAKRLGVKNMAFFFDTGLPDNFYPKSFPIRKQNNVFKLLWIGRLYPRKALLIAIEVVKRFKYPVKLTIVGDGPMGSKLKKNLKNPLLQKRVEWCGQVPWRRVTDYYKRCDALLFTSLRDSCPAQLLEAMAFGLPIVTLNHHGARDLVPDSAGIKVEIGSLATTIKRLINGIEFLIEFPEQRVAMGRAGYKFAMLHKWSHKVHLASQLYVSVINKQKELYKY